MPDSLPPELEEVVKMCASARFEATGSLPRNRPELYAFARHVLRRAGVPGMMEEIKTWQSLHILALREERDALREALKAGSEVMEYMGNVLNGMDVVTEEDEAYANPRFEKVNAALARKPKESS